MLVRYVGPFPTGVDLRIGDEIVTVAHLGVLEVDEALGASLCLQVGNWEQVVAVAEEHVAPEKPAKK